MPTSAAPSAAPAGQDSAATAQPPSVTGGASGGGASGGSGAGGSGSKPAGSAPADASKTGDAAAKGSASPEAGKPNGEVVERDAKGRVTGRSTFRDGVLDGPAWSYGKDGELTQTCRFVAGKLHGDMVIYHDERERMLIPFLFGVREGEAVMYGDGGVVTARLPYVAGTMSGIAHFYGDDGVKTRSATYLDGVEEGETTDFHPNGKVRERTWMVKGKAEGEVVSWHPNGVVHQRQLFRKGKPVGVPKVYDERGRRLPATTAELPRWKKLILKLAKKG
jgi:antitoxin component YwqK of YwqJK toxin-antitoxin module